MKSNYTFLMRSCAMAVAVAGTFGATVAQAAEVSASAAVANMYLFRGVDLGGSKGVPVVSGDIKVSQSGAYTSLWGSSGDATAGSEFDLTVGYAGEVAGVTFDVGAVSYMYPGLTTNGVDDSPEVGEYAEAFLKVGMGPVSASYWDNVASVEDPSSYAFGNGYEYYTLGVAGGGFSATLGQADKVAKGADYTHLDLGYGYNENLSFVMSQVVDKEDDKVATEDEDLKFVVMYMLPIK